MNAKTKNIALGSLVIFLLLVVFYFIFLIKSSTTQEEPSHEGETEQYEETKKVQSGIKRFNSEEEFKKYVSEAGQSSFFLGGVRFLSGGPGAQGLSEGQFSQPLSFHDSSLSRSPKRVSETNVQVAGIDEPDIVKTDGERIYYSRRNLLTINNLDRSNFDFDSLVREIDYDEEREISLINSFPVENLIKAGKIDKYGDLLLYENILIVLADKDIFGYDISDPASPVEKWKISVNEKNKIVQARRLGDKIYLVSATDINHSSPCPFYPVSSRGEEIAISCNDIYHPISPVPVDSNYAVMSIDIESGEVNNKVSFVGSSSNATVYMNNDFTYITYDKPGDVTGIFVDFILEEDDIFSLEAKERAKKIKSYELTQESKMIELYQIIQSDLMQKNSDEKLRLENEIENRIEHYFENHKRELSYTGIVKIENKDLEVKASGIVSGHLLNQFSLDEHDGDLRVATTVGGGGIGVSAENANDVYILDKNLKELGSIKDLGIDERIYSARFIGDKGYLVTFRQIDPFYVLDLSNPKNPKKSGELKIPGYSSYLHPLGKDLILGIGKEDSNVKISLFDVSSPENPTEIDKYTLSDYWSEAVGNHHAFLADEDNSVFFMPGSKGGYVFSYTNSKLEMKVATSEENVKRAVYIDNYLYVIADKIIAVYDESNWSKVRELEL